MANKHSLKLLFLATFTSIVLNAVPSFAATPGIWVGEAEFGTFDLVVNAQGTGIEKITYNLSDWTCGSFTFFSATISVTPPVPWPISDGAFSLTHTSESFLEEMTHFRHI